ncbi:MAG: hypothetical protein J5766_03955 [Clostridia bacterium]|nr:hypothetical protein [Clostridia bacterium]
MSKERACCFFGHKSIPTETTEPLRRQVRSLITEENVKTFYVGTHGEFDYMAYCVLKEMKKEFPDINYAVVLAYLPEKKEEYQLYSPDETLYPDGIEKVPKRYAILWRNDWMLDRCDTMVCYVVHTAGGSGRMLLKAQKKNKRIINLKNYA